jgi:hypothetical protein
MSEVEIPAGARRLRRCAGGRRSDLAARSRPLPGLDSSSKELLGAAGGCEVNAFMGAVAERFRVGLAAAAKRDRVAYLEPVAFGVEESDVAVNEVRAVVGRCDCDLVHCSSCLCCAPARRMRAGALDGELISGREVAREGPG